MSGRWEGPLPYAEMPASTAPHDRMLTSEVRILIADDHEIVRIGLQIILEAQRGWHVVASVSDGKDALQKAIETNPDIAVIGHPLALVNGSEVARQMKARIPRAECLIFTKHEDEMLVTELLRAGARGYLLKSDAHHYLIEAIKALAAHKPYFTPKLSEELLQSLTARSRHRHEGNALTVRERQIVQLIAEGHTNKAIAETLNMSLKTVETHRVKVMRKLDLSSRAALVRYAIRNKLIEP